LIKFILIGLALTFLCFTTYDAQAAVFLKIDSIPGDSTVKGHENQIEINSFQFGVSNAVSTGGTGGAGSGKASFTDLQITKITDKSSPQLFLHSLDSKTLTKAEIFLTKDNGGNQFTFAHYILENLVISSYSISSGGDTPAETVGINYAKLQTETITMNPDGTPGETVKFCWDNVANHECALTPIDTVPPTLSISSPANNALLGTSTITVSGTASDDTSVSSVTWKVDGGTVSTASGTTNWTFTTAPLTDGLHTIEVDATDSAGLVTTQSITVTVDTTPPTLAISSPADHTIILTPTLTVSGTASDDTSVTSVTYKVDSGTESTASGTTSWTFTTPSLSLGVHTIQVTATDAVGLVTTKVLEITYAAPTASIPPLGGGAPIIFHSDAGGFDSLDAITPSSLPTPPPGLYPFGLFSFSIVGFAPATSVTTTITYPTPVAAGTQYLKLAGGIWIPVPFTSSGNSLTLTIADNSPFDSDPTVGAISDPGGIIVTVPGEVSGKGIIGKNVKFVLDAHTDDNNKKLGGSFNYQDKAAHLNFHGNTITLLSIDSTQSQATIIGSGSFATKNQEGDNKNQEGDNKNQEGDNKKSPAPKLTFLATIVDPDKKGTHDQISVTITDSTGKVVYHNSGTVSGHIEIHKATEKNQDDHNNEKDKSGNHKDSSQ
jgi:type VI secretion system Hcp family effector